VKKKSTRGFEIFKAHFSYYAKYHNAGHIKFSFSFWSDGNITTAAKKAIPLQAWTGQRVSGG